MLSERDWRDDLVIAHAVAPKRSPQHIIMGNFMSPKIKTPSKT